MLKGKTEKLIALLVSCW